MLRARLPADPRPYQPRREERMEPSPFLFGLYKLLKYLVYPFTWLCLLLAILTVLAFFRVSSRRLRWIRLLAACSLLVAVLLGMPLAASTLLGLVEQRAAPFAPDATARFDAIVVLGGGVLERGTLRPKTELTDLSLRRTWCGVELFEQGWAPRLVLAGGDASVFGSGPIEAAEMERWARRLGVPAGGITVETRSRTTYESAAWTRRLLGKASVLIVTSASHLARATALFHKQGMRAVGYPCGFAVTNRPGDVWDGDPFDLIPTVTAFEHSTTALTELVGTAVYRALGNL